MCFNLFLFFLCEICGCGSNVHCFQILIACQIVCFVSSCSNLYIKSAMFGMRPMVLAMIVLSGAAGYLIYGL